jgi:hypothetical protein
MNNLCFPQAVKKCPFFRWIDAYKKVAAKKIKEDMEKIKEEMQAAVPYEGHGETKAWVEMKSNRRIYEEERMDLEMDKIIVLVQVLVVLCLVIAVLVIVT